MKMSSQLYTKLSSALGSTMPLNATERQRWDTLWRACNKGAFNIHEAYAEGLDDNNIDTALRTLVKK